jgi:formamidopyrimidine-DNA glycosylase
MPELPEVETVLRTLSPHVAGGQVLRVRLRRKDIVTPSGTPLRQRLMGRRLRVPTRRGKRLIFELDSGDRFIIHLGMTGRLTLEDPGSGCRKHTHLILLIRTRGGRELEMRFCDPRRFGGVRWLAPGEAADAGLGPEPLRLMASELAACLGASRRPIKNALLDQSLVAGLGNIYADEALFAAGIHPQRHVSTLTQGEIRKLAAAIRSTLRRAIDQGGSSIRDYVSASGRKGSYQQRHRVYGREGKPCVRCGRAVERIVLAGRSASFCPQCQAPPR